MDSPTPASGSHGTVPPVPPLAAVPTPLRDGPFLGNDAIRRGLLTRRQLRGQVWSRLFDGVYIHRDVEVTHEIRARAAWLRVPRAVVTGGSAAALWGVDVVPTEADVEVTLPPDVHGVRIRGIRARRAVLAETDVWRRRGIPVTTPEATAVRLCAVLQLDDAVVAIDQLIDTGVVDLARVRARAAVAGGPGSARARTAAALADGLAASPQETRLRLLIRRSTLPAPVAQYDVRHDGRFVARVDFAWAKHKLALEYDGLWHAEAGQFAKDRRRLNELRAAGRQVIHVTAADLHRPERLLSLIAQALASTAPLCG